jgi:mannose-6-phosphate isomerase-like protein (cupin superfamily)
MTSPAEPALLVRGEEISSLSRGKGVSSLPYVGRWNSRVSSVTTGITRIPPGAGIPLHTHNVEETVLVLSGTAIVTIGDAEMTAVAGDATWVPAAVPHCFVNDGSEILEIYWVYAGLNVTRTICATGETADHLSGGDTRGEQPADVDEQRI